MTKQNKTIMTIIIVLLLLVILFGIWWFFLRNSKETNTNSAANINTAASTGLKVTPTVKSEGATKGMTTIGGELSLELTNNKAVLNLPDGALAASDTLAMKEISAIAGIPSGMEFLNGVEISSNGTLLDKPATLTFNIPQNQTSQKFIGFSFSGSGQDFYLYPMKINGTSATLQLTGFSGYGILVLKDDQASPPEPSTVEKQAKHNIARIASEGPEVSADQQNRIVNILRGWYNTSVKIILAEAKNNEDKIEQALHEFISWQATAQFFGLEGAFEAEINQSYDDIALAIKNASSKASKECTESKDPNIATKLFRYMKMTDMLGLNGRAGLNRDTIAGMAEKCLNFELNITINDSYGSTEGMTEVAGAGTGTISFQDNLMLSGSAEVTITRQQTVGLLPCTSNIPETYTINIPEFAMSTSTSGNKFSLLIELGSAPDGLIWECGASARLYEPDARIEDPNPAWMFDFLHEDERVEIKGDFASYLLKDWEIVGSGGVFARKVYQRTKNDTFGLGATFKENLTFELIHKPKP